MDTMATDLSILLGRLSREPIDDDDEAMIVYWNKKERKIHHGGSMGGQLFIEQNQTVAKFYQFCSEIYKAYKGFGSEASVKPSIKETSILNLNTDTSIIEEVKVKDQMITDVTSTHSNIDSVSSTHPNVDSVTCEFSDMEEADDPLPCGFEDNSGHTSNDEVEAEVKVMDKKINRKERIPPMKGKRPRRRKKTHLSNPVKRHRIRKKVDVKGTEVKAEIKNSMIKCKQREKAESGYIEIEDKKLNSISQIKVEACGSDSVSVHLQKNADTDINTDISKHEEDIKEEECLDNSENGLQGKVSCPICKKIYVNKFTLDRHHRRAHSEHRKYQCNVCNLTFATRERRNQHQEFHKKKDGNYICIECTKIFPRRDLYIKHFKEMHKGKTPKFTRVCTLCNVQFINLSGYLKHIESHSNLKMFKCYVCHETFHSQGELDGHVEKHTITLTYKCHKCDKVCSSSEEYQKHVEKYCPVIVKPSSSQNSNDTKDSLLNHKPCDQQVEGNEGTDSSHNELKTSQGEEKSHIVEVTDSADDEGKKVDNQQTKSVDDENKEMISETDNDKEKQNIVFKHSRDPEGHTCDKCGRTFQFAMALYKHKLLHDDNGMFPCRFCHLTFETSEKLTRHSIVHRAVKPYVCTSCKAGFMEPEQLEEHMKKHKRGRTFMCEECGKCYATNLSLRTHMRNHTGVRPYKCKYCDKRFISSETKKVHENTHTKERAFMCDICGMVFYRKCLMYTHKRIHNEKKEYKCSKCGKECRSNAALRTHYVSMHLTQEEAKTFKHTIHECKVCHKYFVDKHDLRAHLRVHTGEKPFSCSYCGKAFSDKSNKTQHEKTHWKVKPFSCNECGKGFVLQRDLLRHSKIHQTGETMLLHPVLPKRKRGRPAEQLGTLQNVESEEDRRQREIKVQIDHLTSKEAGLHVPVSDNMSHHYVMADGYLHVSNSQSFVEQEVTYDSAQNNSNFNILIL